MNKEIAVTSHDQFIKAVQVRVSDLQKTKSIQFPPKYNPDNALISAGLMLQGVKDRNGKPALEVCTKESITSALVNMVVQGLSVAKTQGYFIVYGNKLTFMRSYFGTEASAKRVCPDILEVKPVIVFDGDVFEYHVENGKNVIDKHETSFANMDNDFVGAYCIIEMKQGIPNHIEIMTKKMIKTSWSKGMANSKFQKEFPDQAVKRTIVNRACKVLINTSDDSSLDVAVQAFNSSGGSVFEEIIETDDKKQIETHHGKVEMEVEVETPEKKDAKPAPLKPKPEKVIEREEPKEEPEPEKVEEKPEPKAKISEILEAQKTLLGKIESQLKNKEINQSVFNVLVEKVNEAKTMDDCYLVDSQCMLLTWISNLEQDLKIKPEDVAGYISKTLQCENLNDTEAVKSYLKRLK